MSMFIFKLQRFAGRNSIWNTLLSGTSGNDYLENEGSNVTIQTYGGSDTIINYGTDPTVTSYSYGRNVLIFAGNGHDSISNHSMYTTIDCGAGNDSVLSSAWALSAKVNGGAGNDYIYNYGSLSTLYGGNGKDSIRNDASKVTISGGKDSDTIYNACYRQSDGSIHYYNDNDGSNVVFKYSSGDGNDVVYGFRADSTLSIGGSAKYMSLTVDSDVVVSMLSGGAITLDGAASLSTFNITGGIFVIDNQNSNTVVTGSAGADSINNAGSNVTVDTKGGKDIVTNSGFNVIVNGGANNDSLSNTSANNVTLNGDGGADTLRNSNYNLVMMDGGSGNDKIYDSANYVTMSGGAGNDTIVVENSYAYVTTVYGGAGKDKITAYGGLVDGGSGNDNISIGAYTDGGNAYSATIKGGTGDDTIENYSKNSVLYIYELGNGNDSIRGFNDTDTLQIGDGKGTYSSTVKGSDVIVTVGKGKITLSGAASLDNVNIHGILEDSALNVTISANNSTFNGTKKGDTINNTGSIVKINAQGGKDIITNSGFNVTVNGGVGNDSLSNTTANNVTLNGDGGADILRNSNYNLVMMNGDSGNDKIYNSANYVTMSGGAGNDTIVVENSYAYVTTVYGGAGKDKITAYGGLVDGGSGNDNISIGAYTDEGIAYSATVKGGTGDDTIYGTSAANLIYAFNKGDGHDIIYNSKNGDTVSIGGSEIYTKTTVGSNLVISLISGGAMTLNGASDKNINISGGIESIKSGKEINNTASNTVIGGTNAADTISNNGGSNVDINAGAGNDTIYNSGGNNITLAGGDGDDTINDAYADNISMDGGKGNDSIYGNNNYATITGGEGKDTIIGNHWRSKIFGDGDNDLISLTAYWFNTLDGGAGNDSIIAGGGQHSVNGGAGNDYISLSGGDLTVSGGTGDDTIYGASTQSHLYQYKKGDGKDILYGYNSNDSIEISGGSFSTMTSDNNVIVKVAGTEALTLVGAKGKTINISSDTPDTDTTATQQDVIKKFMYSLNSNKNNSGKSALDLAVNYASNGYFSNLSTVINQMVADCRNLSVNDFLLNKCGINLSNADTGAITGSDAGTATIKTAESVVPEEGNLDTNFSASDYSFPTENGLTFRLSKTDLSKDELYIWRALKTWWAEEGQNLIKESYEYSFLDSDAAVNEIDVVFEQNYTGGYLAYTSYDSYNKKLKLGINKAYYYNFVNSDVNGTSPEGQGYLDRTIAHELTHAIMMAKITNFGDLPQFITEGTAELTHGIDDERGDDVSLLANNSSLLEGSLALMPGTGSDVPYGYAGGYMFLRYLAKQSAEHPSSGSGSMAAINDSVNKNKVTVKNILLTVKKDYVGNTLDLADYSSKVKTVNAKSFGKGMMISGNKNANSIAAGAGNDTIFSNSGKDTLLGGKGNDILYGEGGNDLIKGEAGNDSINGGTGNDTLTGGAGKDIFFFGTGAGKDTITDYTAGQDKIKLIDGGISGASVSGSNLILEGERTGLITINGGKDKKITVIDGNGSETTKKYSDAVKVLTVTNKTKSPVTVGSSTQGVDASARTVAVKITGNALANTIVGGSKNDSLYGAAGNDSLVGNAGNDKLYGGKGNDTLRGGKGNDTLWGDAGADTFIYNSGEGKDIIYGFDKNDTLTLDSLDFTPSYKNKVVTLKFNDGSIALKNFTATTFHINNDTYQISGSKFVKR